MGTNKSNLSLEISYIGLPLSSYVRLLPAVLGLGDSGWVCYICKVNVGC